MKKPLIALLTGLPCALALAQVPGPRVPIAPPPIVTPGGPSGAAPTRPPGLYVQVLDGVIHVSNSGGSQAFAAGQFGYTPGTTQPPVVVPSNPGLVFTPPPVFGSGGGGGPVGPASPGGKSGAVDCEVR
ncbi:hypothetical protein JJB11_06000 [Ramlibacter ginsenosidimutans]|uniref:Uncharacterized protein n=1 Tax=Ramlibacter ginsenosidimutans TaxID=502333 RepID=A0A934TQV0_9BURK|nr:hypothetical protein [Ramlibacter ginsenosidimutans]MBK6005640.1 hypothetical protein [Ramlibacter ginsenosidimutans]